MSEPFGINTSLRALSYPDAQTAIAAGHVYRKPEYTPLAIKHALVIQHGTAEGRPTVDLVLVDEDGREYVTLLTGRLLKSLPI